MLDNNLNMRKFKSGLLIFLLLGSIITIVIAEPETITSEWTLSPNLIHKDGHFSTDPPGTATYLMYVKDDGTRSSFVVSKEKITVENDGTAIAYIPTKWMTDFENTEDEWTIYAGTTSITADTDEVTCSSESKISDISGKPSEAGDEFKPSDNYKKRIKCTAEDSFKDNSYTITVNTKACVWDDTDYANNACNFAGVTQTFSKTFNVIYVLAPKIKALSIIKGGFDDSIYEGDKLCLDWESHFENSRYDDNNAMDRLKIKGLGNYGDLFFGTTPATHTYTTLTKSEFDACNIYYQADSNPSFGNNDYLTENFYFIVCDEEDCSSIGTFKIKINRVEDAPVWTSTEIITATEDTQYTYDATANDPDGDSITFSVTTCPDWLTCEAKSTKIELSGTPTNEDVGTHQVVLSVTDGNKNPVVQSFSITVVNTNDAPEAITTEAEINVKDGSYVSFDLDNYFSDLDDDDLTYSTISKLDCPESQSLSFLQKGALNPNLNKYTAEDEKSGVDYFCIRANDGNSGTEDLRFKVTISNTNDAPTAEDDYVDIQEGTSKQFSSSDFTFEDNDATDSLSKIIVDPTSIKNGELRKGTLTNYEVISRGRSSLEHTITTISNLKYVPNAHFSGEDEFKFKVSDGKEGGESVWYEMTIFVSNVNDIPTITTILPETTEEDTPITINIIAEDIEDKLRDLTLTATSNNENLVEVLSEDIKSKAGIFEVEINPKRDQHGSAQITFTVTDSEGATDTEVFQLTVEPVNDRPTSQDSEITIERSANIIFDQSYFPFDDVEDQVPTYIQITGVPENQIGTLHFKGNRAPSDLKISINEINNLIFKSQSVAQENIEYILIDSNGESSETYSININIEEARFGANSQLCEQGGLRILNSNYCCKGGYIPKPDLFDVSLTSGDIDACELYQNQPPKAVITLPEVVLQTNETITFDGSNSRDPDGIIVNYLWNFDDGSEDITGEIVQHKLETECIDVPCTIGLTVTDNFENSGYTSIELLLSEPNIENGTEITIIPEEKEEQDLGTSSASEPEEEEEPETFEEEPEFDYGTYDYGFDDEPPEKKSPLGWIMILLVLALIGGAVFLWRKGGITKKKPPEAPLETPIKSEPTETAPVSDDKKEHMNKFISEQKDQGQSNEQIRQKLLGKGWSDEEVDKHMNKSRE